VLFFTFVCVACSYDDNDFYDVLAAIANPNHAAASTGCVSWGVIKVRGLCCCYNHQ
jgi:hypothetical protein